MTKPHIKPAILLSMFAALTVASCNAHNPAPQVSVYTLDSDKHRHPLLLHEVQSLHVRSTEASFQIVNPSNDSYSIIFEGTSCSCTGAYIDGKLLQYKDHGNRSVGSKK